MVVRRCSSTASFPIPRPVQARRSSACAWPGVNFTDVYQRTGTYPGTLPFTPGVEGVGTVEKLGRGCDRA